MTENYSKSYFYIDDGYLYRIDGNNHKSRLSVKDNDYKDLEYCERDLCRDSEGYLVPSMFNNFAIPIWKKTLEHNKPEHFTIRRNKKK